MNGQIWDVVSSPEFVAEVMLLSTPGGLVKGVSMIGKGVKIAQSSAKSARVLANIAETRSVSRSSNFKVHVARSNQIFSGYNPDSWKMVELHKGDIVYGGLPGQSAFYTNEHSVLVSNFHKEDLFQILQVQAHPEYGYRPVLGKYMVTKEIRVPFGSVQANPLLGGGSGHQYFINNFTNSLDLVETLELRSTYDYGMSTNRPGY